MLRQGSLWIIGLLQVLDLLMKATVSLPELNRTGKTCSEVLLAGISRGLESYILVTRTRTVFKRETASNEMLLPLVPIHHRGGPRQWEKRGETHKAVRNSVRRRVSVYPFLIFMAVNPLHGLASS